MKYLGIDYGTKRVGCAISDGEAKLAFPKCLSLNSKYLLGDIKRLCKREGIEAIVVGESINLDGSDNLLMDDIRQFVMDLEREVGLPVYLEPEHYTSVQAEQYQGKHALTDASAAAIILQSWLDRKNNEQATESDIGDAQESE